MEVWRREYPDSFLAYVSVPCEMSRPLNFLIVDDNADGRALLNKTLLRKFPLAVISECQNAESAVDHVSKNNPDAVIVHRVWDVDGPTLIRELRGANKDVPIVAVSGIDRTKEALAAGATRFL